MNSGHLVEQYVLLTTKPFLQSLVCFFFFFGVCVCVCVCVCVWFVSVCFEMRLFCVFLFLFLFFFNSFDCPGTHYTDRMASKTEIASAYNLNISVFKSLVSSETQGSCLI